MAISEFDLAVIGWVGNDYEAVSTILEDIARDLQRPVSEDELVASLLALHREGLVDAFVWDSISSQYCKTSIGKVPIHEL